MTTYQAAYYDALIALNSLAITINLLAPPAIQDSASKAMWDCHIMALDFQTRLALSW